MGKQLFGWLGSEGHGYWAMYLLPGSWSWVEYCGSVLCDTLPWRKWWSALYLERAVSVTGLEWWYHPCCLPEGLDRAGSCAVQQGQLNSCSSPEVCRETPTNSYFRDKNPLKHWRQVCCLIRGDQHLKEKANKQSNPSSPCLNGPDTSLQLCKVSSLVFFFPWTKIFHGGFYQRERD